jgi:hypothetical protein
MSKTKSLNWKFVANGQILNFTKLKTAHWIQVSVPFYTLAYSLDFMDRNRWWEAGAFLENIFLNREENIVNKGLEFLGGCESGTSPNYMSSIPSFDSIILQTIVIIVIATINKCNMFSLYLSPSSMIKICLHRIVDRNFLFIILYPVGCTFSKALKRNMNCMLVSLVVYSFLPSWARFTSFWSL